MIKLKNSILENAETIYLVSNTPSFIVRKLQSDPEIVKLSQNLSTDDLISALTEQLKVAPTEFSKVVIPFILAIAISLKREGKPLLALRELDAKLYPGLSQVLDIISSVTKTSSSVQMIAEPQEHSKNVPIPNGQRGLSHARSVPRANHITFNLSHKQ